MRIVFACDTLGSGGAERVISTLSNEFVKENHEVIIVMLSSVAANPYYILDNKIELVYVNKKIDHNIKHLRKAKIIKKILVDLKPDLVISFLSYVCIYTWWALRFTKIPFFVSERNNPYSRSKLKQCLVNRSFKRAAGCIFQTEDALNYYHFIKQDKKIVIYNPVNDSSINLEKKGADKKVILSVGRLEEQKNPLLLIDGFHLFQQKYCDYILKIYGEGSLRTKLEEYISANNIKNVIFCGNNSKWQQDEYGAKAFALTSNYEGMPNSLLEALCLGIPSVATDCPIGGPKEFKKVFPTSLQLIKCGDVDNLARAFEKCILSKHEKPFIPEAFRAKKIAKQWLDFIKEKIR